VRSFFFALLIGIVIALFRVSPVPPLRFIGMLYVEVFRNTPLLCQLLLWGFGLTKAGIQFDSFFTTAVIALSLYTGSFIAETVRSGMLSISVGQAEAARSIGLNFRQSATQVILPQALRTVTAPIGSLFIANHKNTSVCQVLGVAELSFIAEEVGVQNAMPAQALIGAAFAYLAITYPAGILVGIIERKTAIKR
jgi:glutamate transport system permease protein